MHDVTVVGAGIVGLATSYRLLQRHPDLRVTVLEKEARPAAHQTGHNSGVVHTGVYYAPGSLKARLCVGGARRLMAFCEEHGVRCEQYGKVIVAASESERPMLQEIARRGRANGVVGLRELDAPGLRRIEPYAAGVAALHVPTAASVDFRTVARTLVDRIQEMGGAVQTGTAVRTARQEGDRLVLETAKGDVCTRFLINCAGLQADRVAKAAGVEPPLQIVPFRGEYYALKGARRDLVRGMIYPVPDARVPFLGVHLTRTVDGAVEAGPNAVLAFAREGYRRTTIRPADVREAFSYPGFRALGRKYWRVGVGELSRSLFKSAFVRTLQRLVPDLTPADLERGPAGVRAQAVSRAGELVDDFVISHSPRAVHVLNAPSPAATACLAIADYVGDVAKDRFGLRGSRPVW